jgi:hypothetical protein
MKQQIEQLKNLGANVQQVKGGLKLIGNWDSRYADFDDLFVEITGSLYTSNSVQDKDFLKNVTTLGSLNTSNSVQDKDFLKNLTTLGSLNTSYSVQDKDFLKNLTTLGSLNTSYSVQDKDFLKNLTTLGSLYTSNSVQDKDFLKNVTTLGSLYTSHSVQDKDFLKNLTTLGSLNTSYSVQDKDFLKNLTTLGSLYTSNSVQDKDFLKNLTTLGSLDTYYSVQDKDFLKNLTTLGSLNTYNSVQDKDFLKNVSYKFKLPLIFADGILSEVISTKIVSEYTVQSTRRIGYTDVEYIATNGEHYAHAKSVKLAISDLKFKLVGRDTSWLLDKTIDSVLSIEDAILAYRAITGACSGGVEGFLSTIKEKSKYTIGEVIELTKNQYGNTDFVKFFNK